MAFLRTFILIFHILWATASSALAALDFQQTFTTTVDFATISRNRYQGLYKIDVRFQWQAPQALKLFKTDVGDDENGVSTIIEKLSLEGNPLVRVEMTTSLVDRQGAPLKTFAPYHYELRQKSISPPIPETGYRATLSGYLVNSSAAPIDDTKGRAFLFSVSGFHQVEMLFKPDSNHSLGFDHYEATRDNNLRLRLDWVDPENFANKFTTSLLVPLAREASEKLFCDKPGEVLPVAPLTLMGQTVSRVQVCYKSTQTPAGYERIVLPVQKPALHAIPEKAMTAILQGPENSPKGRVAVHPLWLIPQSEMAETNCHGYALKSVLKEDLMLPPHVTWVEGIVAVESEGTLPFVTLLKAHFKKVWEGPEKTWDQKETRTQVREGDLVTFFNGAGYVHSGVLVRESGSRDLWVQSKLEEGPVVNTPLSHVKELYIFKKIEVYRKQK